MNLTWYTLAWSIHMGPFQMRNTRATRSSLWSLRFHVLRHQSGSERYFQKYIDHMVSLELLFLLFSFISWGPFLFKSQKTFKSVFCWNGLRKNIYLYQNENTTVKFYQTGSKKTSQKFILKFWNLLVIWTILIVWPNWFSLLQISFFFPISNGLKKLKDYFSQQLRFTNNNNNKNPEGRAPILP